LNLHCGWWEELLGYTFYLKDSVNQIVLGGGLRMSWNKLTPTVDVTKLYVRSPFPGKKIIDPPVRVKVKAKNSKARRITIQHGNVFDILKLSSTAQYVRSSHIIFAWEGWLYDNDIEYEGRTQLRMRILK